MPGRPLEAGDRVFGVAGESLRAGGHVVGVGSPKNEILRSEQKVSYLDHLGVQRRHRDIRCSRDTKNLPGIPNVLENPPRYVKDPPFSGTLNVSREACWLPEILSSGYRDT